MTKEKLMENIREQNKRLSDWADECARNARKL